MAEAGNWSVTKGGSIIVIAKLDRLHRYRFSSAADSKGSASLRSKGSNVASLAPGHSVDILVEELEIKGGTDEAHGTFDNLD